MRRNITVFCDMLCIINIISDVKLKIANNCSTASTSGYQSNVMLSITQVTINLWACAYMYINTYK